MRSTPKGMMLKVSIVVFAVVVCIAATAIQAWQERSAKAVSQPLVGGMSSFMPTTTPALW